MSIWKGRTNSRHFPYDLIHVQSTTERAYTWGAPLKPSIPAAQWPPTFTLSLSILKMQEIASSANFLNHQLGIVWSSEPLIGHEPHEPSFTFIYQLSWCPIPTKILIHWSIPHQSLESHLRLLRIARIIVRKKVLARRHGPKFQWFGTADSVDLVLTVY